MSNEREPDPPDTPETLRGKDNRLPATVNTPEAMVQLTHKTNMKLQRSAHQMMSRIKKLRLFGTNREEQPDIRDNAAIQLLFAMREAIEEIEDIEDLSPYQQVLAHKTRIAGLTAIGALQQQIVADCAKITANTNKSLVDVARLSLDRKKAAIDDDDITDAELA